MMKIRNNSDLALPIVVKDIIYINIMKSFILGLTAASAVSASTSFLAPKVVNQVTAISNISDDLNGTLY